MSRLGKNLFQYNSTYNGLSLDLREERVFTTILNLELSNLSLLLVQQFAVLGIQTRLSHVGRRNYQSVFAEANFNIIIMVGSSNRNVFCSGKNA